MAGGKQISNPAGVWGETGDVDQTIIPLINNSGGTLAPGDIVVIDVTGTKCSSTTTASHQGVVGVVAEPSQGLLGAASSGKPFASGAVIPVVVQGPARINIGGNTVAALGNLSTSTTAKVAATAADAANVGALQALAGTRIAIALEADSAKDANNTIRAYIQKF